MNIQVVVLLIVFYFIFTLIFRYLLVEKLKMIDMIFNSKKPNKRNELIGERRKAKETIKSAWYWPILLIKEVKNGFRQKK